MKGSLYGKAVLYMPKYKPSRSGRIIGRSKCGAIQVKWFDSKHPAVSYVWQHWHIVSKEAK